MDYLTEPSNPEEEETEGKDHRRKAMKSRDVDRHHRTVKRKRKIVTEKLQEYVQSKGMKAR